MKTSILVLSFFVVSLFAVAQKPASKAAAKTPPAVVTKAFAEKFKGAEKAKWDQEESTEWEVEFMLAGKEASASFDLAGKWLETETEVATADLPASVKTAIDKQYPGCKYGEASTFESATFSGYEIALKVKGKAVEVQVTKDGKLKVNSESGEKKDKD